MRKFAREYFGALLYGSLAFSLGACAYPLTATVTTPPTTTGQEIKTIAVNALEAGTLACKYGGVIAAVVGVKVTDKQAQAVAAACSVITVGNQIVTGATPAPLPNAVTVPVATVPAPVAAAVNASSSDVVNN